MKSGKQKGTNEGLPTGLVRGTSDLTSGGEFGPVQAVESP